jgi:hypothetical protein
MEVLAHQPGCLVDELTQACPAFTWNQVFAAIDQLSRTGQVRLGLEGRGRYRVWSNRPDEPLADLHNAVRTEARPGGPAVTCECIG